MLADAQALCAAHGLDLWAEIRGTVEEGGWTILGPDCVLLVQPDGPDALFVSLAMGEHYLPRLLALVPPWVVWLRWRREFRLAGDAPTRQCSVERLRNLVSSHGLQTTASASQRPAAGDRDHRAERVHRGNPPPGAPQRPETPGLRLHDFGA